MRGRRELLLKEVVDRYIRTRQPVSSKTLVEEYGHRFSSATVRNELAALEREGYLWKPYPSSGRIPTKAAFRFFAEWLLELAEIKERPETLPAELPEIVPQELPELLRRTALLLSTMTGQLAFVLAPEVEALRLAGLVMRRIGPGAVLVVVLSELGVVESRVLQLRADLSPEVVGQVEVVLSRRVRGLTLRQLVELGGLDVEGWHDRTVLAALDLLRGLAQEGLRRRLYVEGVTQLLRDLSDQPPAWAMERVCGLLRLLEDERRFAEILSHLRQDEQGLTVTVGEPKVPELSDFSLVTAPYFGESGMLGVIGPLWLDYARSFSATRYVASRLKAILATAGRIQEVSA
ncbi:MAG TPA: heat-inducible transcription repressor HrcA [Candidatus Acetothermia bacterium]|nr:heat-inducible transcription repressor HrcA [Candidatus Acetothermia bacterium]